MLNVVTRSKYVNETIPITWDFSDLLQPREVISNVTVIVTLFSGIDSNPSNILYNAPIISGSTVTQNVRSGIPGCNYEIVFSVVSSSSHTYEKSTNLAILPLSGQAIPSFTIIYEDTCLYPYELLDALTSSPLFQSGLLGYLWSEYVTAGVGWVSGILGGNAVAYQNPPENIQSTIGWVSGVLAGTSVIYQNPPEDIKVNVAWISGVLNGIGINYAIPAEWLQSSISWFSGSIT